MTPVQTSLTVECKVHFTHAGHGRKQMVGGVAPVAATVPLGRVPRLARLMALSIRFEALLAQGEVRDYADLARLGHVTRARVTQIMNLLNLAPDIQEELLFLTPVERGRGRVHEWMLRPIAARSHWQEQRVLWRQILKNTVTQTRNTSENSRDAC
jgi:hypothetical protein